MVQLKIFAQKAHSNPNHLGIEQPAAWQRRRKSPLTNNITKRNKFNSAVLVSIQTSLLQHSAYLISKLVSLVNEFDFSQVFHKNLWNIQATELKNI